MKKRAICRFVYLPLLLLMVLPLCASGAEKRVQLIGKETLNFSLPSTQDRLINYAEEYYGKHHLIITFFPAAFTPV